LKKFTEYLNENINDLRTIKSKIKSDSTLINRQIQTRGKDGKMIQIDYKKDDDEFMIRYGKNETEYFSEPKKVINFVNSLV